jgi:hypothetical protein
VAGAQVTSGGGVPPGAFARVASQDPALPPCGWDAGDSDLGSSRGSFGSLDEEYVRDSLAALGTPLPPAAGLGSAPAPGNPGAPGAARRGGDSEGGGGGGGAGGARATGDSGGELAQPWFDEWSAGLEAQLRAAPRAPGDGDAVRPLVGGPQAISGRRACPPDAVVGAMLFTCLRLRGARRP